MGQVIQMTGKCIVDGCETAAYARGLCTKHYNRNLRAGTTADPRPELSLRGPKNEHRLWKRWLALKKRDVLCPEWCDFWRFVDELPEQGDSRKLSRPNPELPYGPGNAQWTERLDGERKVAYYREYGIANADTLRDQRFRKKYGIGLGEYDRMFAEQNGRCAICRQPERGMSAFKKGELKRLAIDHDHDTSAVRGLLCSHCNQGLGCFDDSQTNLFAAIQYLGRYKSVGKVS